MLYINKTINKIDNDNKDGWLPVTLPVHKFLTKQVNLTHLSFW